MPSFGTIKADTLTHSTAGSLATNFVVRGTAKAWFDAFTFATPDNSFNVSSVADDAAGQCTPSFTTSFADAHYTLHGTSSDADGVLSFDRDFDATGSKKVLHYGGLAGSAAYGDATLNASFIGDLA